MGCVLSVCLTFTTSKQSSTAPFCMHFVLPPTLHRCSTALPTLANVSLSNISDFSGWEEVSHYSFNLHVLGDL